MPSPSSNTTKKDTTPIPFTPLGQIALSISGGGFRAAAFGLGCLSYLNRCKLTTADGSSISLLKRVCFIASASGGSFVNLLYAKYLYEGESIEGEAFQKTYIRLRDFMHGETLLNRAMCILETDDHWHQTSHHKQRNLINAFSLAYDELFEKANFGLFCDAEHQNVLKQICVNSTEFQNGLSFRFQNIDGAGRTGLIGNFGLSLRSDCLSTIRKLKLADIMAASSCFPAGMEPIMFPRDFLHQMLTEGELRGAIRSREAITEATELVMIKKGKLKNQSISDTDLNAEAEEINSMNSENLPGSMLPTDFSFGLMDGGINDNQAISSLMLAEKRYRGKNKQPGFDTFIVCDVNSRYISAYKLPDEPYNGLNRFSIRALSTGLALLLAGFSLIIYWFIPSDVWRFGLIGACTSLLLLEVTVILWAWIKFNTAGGGTWGEVWHRYKGYFFTIPLGTVKQMLSARISSVVLLAGDIMMKQIRRLIFDSFYENDKWKNRRVASFLNALTRKTLPLTNLRSEHETGHKGPTPSVKMQDCADAASQMDTTLWFNGTDFKDNIRDQLIATGQFTMCYNLLRYLDQIENLNEIPQDYKKHLGTLKEQLKSDWETFQENPVQFVPPVCHNSLDRIHTSTGSTFAQPTSGKAPISQNQDTISKP
ncbi:hypothetical protein [Spirosoma fluviale]|uniref:Patatin-like phospholipase n=1 Tax=Spirosoma fluviale TaxID=1597977 RepID=A0A286GGZ4_9BACT|nr:hypothetical protein [Spirosoma fluviale]SOD94742.1 hypothetical protein SAMN06269250_4624 [Spirosoma fluviale]